jgi:hypothetical protein
MQGPASVCRLSTPLCTGELRSSSLPIQRQTTSRPESAVHLRLDSYFTVPSDQSATQLLYKADDADQPRKSSETFLTGFTSICAVRTPALLLRYCLEALQDFPIHPLWSLNRNSPNVVLRLILRLVVHSAVSDFKRQRSPLVLQIGLDTGSTLP